MIKGNYLLLCENVNRDIKNRTSLINIFDIVGGEQLPVIPKDLVVAFSITIGDDDIKDGAINIKLSILNSDNKKVAEMYGDGRLASAGTLVSSLDLGGKIAFKKEDNYIIKLDVNDQSVCETTLKVIKGEMSDAQ